MLPSRCSPSHGGAWLGDAYPPSRLSVYVVEEPHDTEIWTMAGGWSAFRAGLRAWSSEPSDYAGALDLCEPALCECDDALDLESCPLILKLEKLRKLGVACHQCGIRHRTDSGVPF